MKKVITLLLIISGLNGFSQLVKKTTGDTELDNSIKSLTAVSRKDGEMVRAALVSKYNVSQEDALKYQSNYTGGDIFMILETAKETGKKREEVFAVFNKNNGYKTWQEMLKELGVKPDSKSFLAIKEGVINNGID